MGVGGEYPLAASSAAERAEGDVALRQRRGEMVVLTFSQQGWGNFTNSERVPTRALPSAAAAAEHCERATCKCCVRE